MALRMCCSIIVFMVCGSLGESNTIGFQLLPCELFKDDRNVTSLLKLSIAPMSLKTSVLTCLSDVGLNSTFQAPQWALISGDLDMTSLQCQSLTFTSSLSDAFVTESEIMKEAQKPFCQVYFTSGESCETSLLNGWMGLSTMTWSGDLDTWANCNNVKDGGGWTVIQRRQDGSVDFYRGWQDYKLGFGSLAGEFWFGLENIRRLLALRKCQLRIDMTKNDGERYYAVYNDFEIADESLYYRLTVGSYSGDAGDAFSHHSGRTFDTKDRMPRSQYTCPEKYGGGFWYRTCHAANPNGIYGSTIYGQGITWKPLTGFTQTLPFFEMKIRPIT